MHVWTSRLSCCEKVLQESRLDSSESIDTSLLKTQCISLAVAGYQHTKEEVRMSAFQLMMELYKVLGRQAILDQISTPPTCTVVLRKA